MPVVITTHEQLTHLMAISYPYTKWSCNGGRGVFAWDGPGRCPRRVKVYLRGQSRLLDVIVEHYLSLDKHGGRFYRDGLDIKRADEKDVVCRIAVVDSDM
jgi:hypothetical protein